MGQIISTTGYGRVSKPGTRYRELAHRVSYEMFKGPIPSDLCVLHTCDVPSCVNPNHLWLGTRGDNRRDAVAKDRHAKALPSLRGSKHHSSVLTEDAVRHIKSSADSGVSLAKLYGVTKGLISQIRNGRAWKHVT